ncbi:MAG: hypothetical protein JWP14_3148 [Frankiales bacterium]|nr:hypothetical protein [Frankiales bacterium]
MVRHTVGGVVLGLALSACGSTVQVSSALSSGDGLATPGDNLGNSLGTGTTGTASGGGSSIGPATGSGGSSGFVDGTSGGGSATGGPRPASTPSSAPLATQAATGLGVTATTISIGIGYTSDGDAANAAIGASGVTSGDEKANSQALVDEVNAHGGVAGRRLVPVFHAYRITSSDSGATQDEAACQDWTVDHKVLAVFSSSLTDTLVACLKKAGVVMVKGGQIVDADAAYLRQYSNEVLLGTMSIDRIFADQVRSLVRQDWFTGWNTVTGKPGTAVKVGVLTYDTDSFDRGLHRVLLPALKAAGHAPAAVDVLQVHKPEQQSDAAGTTAQIKSAVLRMQQDGVTHLVLGDASGFILEFFGSNARAQGYYPRLGVTSGAGVQVVHDAGLVTDQQLNGMGGNGWLPTLDLIASESATYVNAETRRCLDIMKRRTGQTYTSSNAATIALSDCDAMFLFQRAMRSAATLTPAGLISAVDGIGHAYTSPVVGPTFLSPRQHDDAVRAWDLNWVESCTCVKYSSQHDVPSA